MIHYFCDKCKRVVDIRTQIYYTFEVKDDHGDAIDFDGTQTILLCPICFDDFGIFLDKAIASDHIGMKRDFRQVIRQRENAKKREFEKEKARTRYREKKEKEKENETD